MVQVSLSGKARLKRCEKHGLCTACLQPLKSRKGRVIRGMHQSCRRLATIAIERGDTTEDQLIRDGQMKPQNPGRRPSNPFTREVRGLDTETAKAT